MKRLLIAVGAIAATTLAIEKMIEYAMKQDENEDIFTEEEVYEGNDEFICLNEVEEEQEPEEVVEEIAEEIEEKVDAFDDFVDEAGDTIKEIGGKVRSFLSDLPKIRVTINIDKEEK